MKKIKIGISSCLLGEKVRFDGGHKRQPFLVDHFGPFVSWVPVCPEFELGLGVPRPSLRLEGNKDHTRLIMPKIGKEYTHEMSHYSQKKVKTLQKKCLDGYIFKKDSPSCGIHGVRIYDKNGVPKKSGQGFFSKCVIDSMPFLPVEEEGRLNDPRIRENFITRVFSHSRWQQITHSNIKKNQLLKFHEHYKLHLMARNQVGLKRLGNFLAHSSKNKLSEKFINQYFEEFSKIMSRVPTRKGHTNVLFHMAGYFSKKLKKEDRGEIKEIIEIYLKGNLPLIAPLILIRHHVRQFEVSYLKNQVYLYPHPDELALLNQI